MKPILAPALGLGLGLLAAAPLSAQGTMTDREYCTALSATYNRYLGQTARTNTFPDVAAGNAIADCERGNTAAAIPVLERKLRNAGFTLPVRETPVTRNGN